MITIKPALAAVAAASALAIAGAAQAATTVSISNITATWQNPVEGVNGSSVTYNNNGTANAEVRWGTPSNTQKSGYDFNVAGTGDFNIDVEAPYDSGNFIIGDLTHHNYVVKTGTGIQSIGLLLTADVTVGSVVNTVSYSFSYDFNHWETPNSTPCPIGTPAQNSTPCADQVTMNFNSLTDSFLVDGTRYTVDLVGFVNGPDDMDPVREFITPENKSTTAHIVARVSAVPEPATWAMLIAGFGMIGLAARRRRSREYQSQ